MNEAENTPVTEQEAPEAPAASDSIMDVTANQESEAPSEGNAEPKAEAEQSESKEAEQKPEDEKPAGAPEQYEEFRFVEGYTLDEQAKTDFTALAKEFDLSQEKAQKLVDFQTALITKGQAALDAKVEQQKADWRAETEKAYTPEEIADGIRGFKSVPQGVRDMLQACGFENHKDFMKMFIDIGRTLKEDKFETGKPSGTINRSAAQVLYPNLK